MGLDAEGGRGGRGELSLGLQAQWAGEGGIHLFILPRL